MVTILIGVLAWKRNRDPFSPVKIYLAYSVFFYLGIYIDSVRWETFLCYAALIFSIGLCLAFEPQLTERSQSVEYPKLPRLYRLIWLFSIPGILVKIYFIYEAGGLFDYVANLAFRVRDWAGRGHFVIWFNILPALSLIYFCGIIADRNRSWRSITAYGAHFIIFLVVGLITGSRSYIAITLLGMVVMYSYLVKPVRLRWIVATVFLLVILAGVIGAARNNFGNIENGELLESVTSLEEFETTQIRYGIIPLEIIFESSEKTGLFGTTYVSLFTNFIPRSIFPNKPDTGGIAFTKIYTDDQWGGLSNLATGAVTEAILNFGKPLGIAIGIALNAATLVLGCLIYRRFMYRKSSAGKHVTVFHVAAYFYIIISFARFSFAEFTDIFQSMIFYALIPYGLLKLASHRTASSANSHATYVR